MSPPAHLNMSNFNVNVVVLTSVPQASNEMCTVLISIVGKKLEIQNKSRS